MLTLLANGPDTVKVRTHRALTMHANYEALYSADAIMTVKDRMQKYHAWNVTLDSNINELGMYIQCRSLQQLSIQLQDIYKAY